MINGLNPRAKDSNSANVWRPSEPRLEISSLFGEGLGHRADYSEIKGPKLIGFLKNLARAWDGTDRLGAEQIATVSKALREKVRKDPSLLSCPFDYQRRSYSLFNPAGEEIVVRVVLARGSARRGCDRRIVDLYVVAEREGESLRQEVQTRSPIHRIVSFFKRLWNRAA